MSEDRPPARIKSDNGHLRLGPGAEVGVVGGGPAGSFFSLFLLQMAWRAGLNLRVTIYEPRDFTGAGAKSCNMCGGIISESLLQNLAAEGLRLPRAVVQKRIDSYFLHMDVGNVRIETPLGEKRIAAVYRDGGPRGSQDLALASVDGRLLDLATGKGASGSRTGWWPRTWWTAGRTAVHDLLVGACGINSPGAELFEKLGCGYRAPRGAKAYICEFQLGADVIRRYFGASMHVFLLDIPRLKFAAIMPKRDDVTVCLLGDDIDKDLVQRFVDAPEVRACMPPQWQAPDRYCQCFPKVNVDSGVRT